MGRIVWSDNTLNRVIAQFPHTNLRLINVAHHDPRISSTPCRLNTKQHSVYSTHSSYNKLKAFRLGWPNEHNRNEVFRWWFVHYNRKYEDITARSVMCVDTNKPQGINDWIYTLATIPLSMKTTDPKTEVIYTLHRLFRHEHEDVHILRLYSTSLVQILRLQRRSASRQS